MAKINLPFYLRPVHTLFNTNGWISEAAEPAGIWRKDSVNFGDIFNTWLKFSRGNSHNATIRQNAGFSNNAVPSDLAFSYNSADDTVSNPVDTTSMVGFVSPASEAYDEYYFEVQIRSRSNWQSDPVGLVMAYAIDPDGTAHTLTVFRRMWHGYSGANAPLTVEVDHLTIGEVFIKRTYGGLKYNTGYVPTEASPILPNSSPWSYSPWDQNPNGVRIKVERRGDIFVINTTQYNGITYVPEATTIIDLNSHPSLARFKGKCRYGYCCHSQDNTYWRPIFRPGGWRRPFWCSEFAGKESAYAITNYEYSYRAYTAGDVRGGGGPTPQPGEIDGTGLRFGRALVLRNWKADSTDKWRFDRDLYIIGPDIKESDLLKIGLHPADRCTSSRKFYIQWDMRVDHDIERGFYDYNIDANTWTWHAIWRNENHGGGRQHNTDTWGPHDPPPSRHIYIPGWWSARGDHYDTWWIHT